MSTAQGARWRRFWLVVHLWLGLGLGALLALVGVTGSLLVFYLETDRWLNPAVAVTRRAVAEHSLQEVFDAIRAAEPARTRGWRLEIPRESDRAYHARYYFPVEKAGRAFAPLIVTVDPYTLSIRQRRFWGDFAMTWIYDLHYTMLLGRAGNYLLGIAGVLALVSLGTGLCLWWPRGTRWQHALTWKRRAGPERTTYDVHKLSGAYGVLLLAVVIGTGVCLELPAWVEPFVSRLSPVEPVPELPATVRRRGPHISLDSAVAAARERFPDAAVRWVETPDGDEGVFRIRMQQPGEPSERFPRTFAWVDPVDGRLLAARDSRGRSAGDAFLAWLHPLHSGEALGLTGRWLVLISGLLPAALFTTGLIRWRHKIRARRLVRSRHARSTPAARAAGDPASMPAPRGPT